MRLFYVVTARRFTGLALLLFFSIPFGLSVTGCGHKSAPPVYCNASDSGPTVGQVASITLSPSLATTGESLNYGQYGQALSASALDCKGNAVSVSRYTYASSDSTHTYADINPSSGQVCAGTWNRNTGGGIADYTICTASATVPIYNLTPVPVTASPYTYTATSAGTVAIYGGSVTSISYGPNPPTTQAYTANTSSGLVSVNAGDTVTIVYTSAPTVYLLPATAASASTNGSPYTYQATAAGTLAVANYFSNTTNTTAISKIPTVTAISVTHNGLTTGTGSTAGLFTVQIGDTVSISYTGSGAPGIVFTPFGAVAYVTATASGAVSNAIPVYVHPITTSIVIGPASTSCTTDPGTDCCPNNTSGTPIAAPVYTGTSCISQNTTGQLIARVYQGGTTTPANNITCQVGHISFSPQSSNIVSIDQNGVVTANQPGGTIITANLTNGSSGSSAGFFATCPPASITLSVPGQPTGTGSVNVSINNLQPLTAVVMDKNNVVLNGLSLEFNSTTPQTIPASTGSVTPTYPGTAVITAVCQPGSCNPAPFSQIGLYGNGDPITSNGITINATGKASTVIYMGSTSSQYVLPMDFTTNQPSSLLKLPYVPNSMVITQDGSSIYLGSPQGLMSISTATNTQGNLNQSVPGTVLAVSPDGTTVVITDPVRQTVSLYSPTSSSVFTSYGAIGTSAKWSPDSQTVYITTTTGVVLTHSSFTNWQTTAASETYTNVAVTVPSVGAYFSGPSTLDGRSYCPSGVATGAGTPQTVNNTFTPLADTKTVPAQTLATTNDGLHVLTANVTANTTTATLSDLGLINGSGTTSLPVTTACPGVVTPGYFPSTLLTAAPLTLTGVQATAINSIVPAANSSQAFITYTGAGGLLPQYVPSPTGPGTLKFITLGNGATVASAPVSGVFSTDGLTFYVGTSGATSSDFNSVDNDVHILSITGTSVTETGILSPALPPASGNGAAAPVNLLVQKPKKSQI